MLTADSPEEEVLWAAERGLAERVGQLLRQDPALVSARDGDGYTPLHRAAYNDHLVVVEVRAGEPRRWNAMWRCLRAPGSSVFSWCRYWS